MSSPDALEMRRFAIAFCPLTRARRLVRGLRQGLTEDERYLVADDVVKPLQQHGDPWRLSEELPEATAWKRHEQAHSGGTSSLLNGREQPIPPTRTHEGPQFGGFAPLATFDGLSARALDHTVFERKVHGHGRIIGVAFAPGFRQIAS